MVKIRDVLTLNLFQDAVLVAGADGHGRDIRWVHIVSMPDTDAYEWTHGGELILTVGYGLDNPQRQRQIIQQMVARGIAGMVISVGHHLDQTPHGLRAEADRLGFPIIEIPGDRLFVDITEAIFTEIVNQHYATQQKLQYIHNMLTAVVLDGGTLQDLVEALARYLDKSITIESANFDVLADIQIGSVDEARRRSVEAGRSTPELIDKLAHDNVYERLLKTRSPERISPQPDIGMDMERVIAPIIVARKIIGYVWIIGDNTRLSPFDELAIEQAATVAALFMYKEQAVYEMRMSSRGDFLNMLLATDGTPDALLESKANQVGFQLNRNYQVITVRSYSQHGELAELIPQQVENYLETITQAFTVMRDEQVLVILQSLKPPDGKQIAKDLLQHLNNAQHRIIAGVGLPVTNPQEISASFEQAREALSIAQTLSLPPSVLAFEDLGILHWLQKLPRHILTENIYYQAIHKLHVKDNREKKVLLPSLEAFLKYGGNIKEAAQELFVHRNTLIYRLERVESFTGLDLKNPDVQLNLSVAVQTFRLREQNGPSIH